MPDLNTIICGDALSVLQTLASESVHCIVTSPPFWGLRDYGVTGQIGIEATPEQYVDTLVTIFHEARRVLRADGTCWLNLGDCYAGAGDRRSGKGNEHGQAKRWKTPSMTIGLKPKDLVGIPWRVAFALQDDGWWLRADCIWHKPNCMPESVRDRPTKSHEYVFLLTKSERYYYDADAVREPAEWSRWGKQTTKKRNPGTMSWVPDRTKEELNSHTTRNKRDVWSIPTRPYHGAHFAVMPPALVEPCVKAGSPAGGIVLDPFMGAGTVAMVASQQGRQYIGIELNETYVALARNRLAAA